MNQAFPPQPPQAPPAEKKPQLQVLLEDLESAVQELRRLSDEYTDLKSVYSCVESTGALPSDCELTLVIPPGRSIQLTSLGGPEQTQQALAESINSIGAEVLEQWQKIATAIVQPAIAKCQAAAQRVAAAQG